MTGELPCCFAVVADDEEQPAAAFQNLEDALDWAVARFGSNGFRVRHLRLVAVDRRAAAMS
jgi:hypothetical protein